MPRAVRQPERPAEAGFLVVDGRTLPYQVTFSSKRRRSYGFTVDKEGTIQFRAARFVRVAELIDFAKRRKRFIAKRLQELEARAARDQQKSQLTGKWSELPILWWKRAAKHDLPLLLKFWAKKIGVDYGTVTITSGRSVWGSCSSHGNLSFSYRLMQVPVELRAYVVVHELCHRKHMNHGARFWALVGKYVPDYVEKRRRLNKLGGEIG